LQLRGLVIQEENKRPHKKRGEKRRSPWGKKKWRLIARQERVTSANRTERTEAASYHPDGENHKAQGRIMPTKQEGKRIRIRRGRALHLAPGKKFRSIVERPSPGTKRVSDCSNKGAAQPPRNGSKRKRKKKRSRSIGREIKAEREEMNLEWR